MKKAFLRLALGLALASGVFLGCAKAPVAAFSADPLSGTPPLEVNFTDESENDPTSWEWHFGDGNTSIEQNPTYIYEQGGFYTVTLIVSNDHGTDTVIEPDYIEVGEFNYEKFDTLGMTFQWRTDQDSLYVKLSAPTTGWVAVGFDPTSAMRDANFIIGYVQGNDVFISDSYGDGNYSHEPDSEGGGNDNVADKKGSESATSTQISFTIPLDSGDPRDRPLVAGQTYTILLAYGPDGSDGFTLKHATKAKKDLEL